MNPISIALALVFFLGVSEVRSDSSVSYSHYSTPISYGHASSSSYGYGYQQYTPYKPYYRHFDVSKIFGSYGIESPKSSPLCGVSPMCYYCKIALAKGLPMESHDLGKECLMALKDSKVGFDVILDAYDFDVLAHYSEKTVIPMESMSGGNRRKLASDAAVDASSTVDIAVDTEDTVSEASGAGHGRELASDAAVDASATAEIPVDTDSMVSGAGESGAGGASRDLKLEPTVVYPEPSSVPLPPMPTYEEWSAVVAKLKAVLHLACHKDCKEDPRASDYCTACGHPDSKACENQIRRLCATGRSYGVSKQYKVNFLRYKLGHAAQEVCKNYLSYGDDEAKLLAKGTILDAIVYQCEKERRAKPCPHSHKGGYDDHGRHHGDDYGYDDYGYDGYGGHDHYDEYDTYGHKDYGYDGYGGHDHYGEYDTYGHNDYGYGGYGYDSHDTYGYGGYDGYNDYGKHDYDSYKEPDYYGGHDDYGHDHEYGKYGYDSHGGDYGYGNDYGGHGGHHHKDDGYGYGSGDTYGHDGYKEPDYYGGHDDYGYGGSYGHDDYGYDAKYGSSTYGHHDSHHHGDDYNSYGKYDYNGYKEPDYEYGYKDTKYDSYKPYSFGRRHLL